MELGSTDEIYENAHHPYTLGLQNAFPDIEGDVKDLISIPGAPPNLANPPEGCPFAARCPFADEECAKPLPQKSLSDDHRVWCHEPQGFDHIRSHADDPVLWTEGRSDRRDRYVEEKI